MMRKPIITRLAGVWRRFRLYILVQVVTLISTTALGMGWPPQHLWRAVTAGILVSVSMTLFVWTRHPKDFEATLARLGRHAPWWPEVWFAASFGGLAVLGLFPHLPPLRLITDLIGVPTGGWVWGCGLMLGSLIVTLGFLFTLSPELRAIGYSAVLFLMAGLAGIGAPWGGDELFVMLGVACHIFFGMFVGWEVAKQAQPGETVGVAIVNIVRRGRGKHRFGVPDEEWFKTCYEASKLLAEGFTWEEVTSRLYVKEKTLRRWLEVYESIRRDLHAGDPPETVAQRYNRSLPVLFRYLRRLSER
jgi:hypothetical protein